MISTLKFLACKMGRTTYFCDTTSWRVLLLLSFCLETVSGEGLKGMHFPRACFGGGISTAGSDFLEVDDTGEEASEQAVWVWPTPSSGEEVRPASGRAYSAFFTASAASFFILG